MTRTWNWFRRIAIGMGVLLLLAVGYLVVDRVTAQSALQRYEAELDATEPGWRYADIVTAYNARVPPPEQNATELAMRALKLVPKDWQNWQLGPNVSWLPNPDRNHLPMPEKLAEARRVRKVCQPALELARTIPAGMIGGEAIVNTPNPIVGLPPPTKLRDMLALLALDANVSAADRDSQLAVRSIIAQLRYASSLQGEPSLFAMLQQLALISTAAAPIEVLLAYTEPTDAELRDLQAAWEAVPLIPIIETGMRSERAVGHQMMQFIKSGGGSTGIYILARIASGYFQREHLAMLRTATRVIEIQKRPPHEWTSQFGQEMSPRSLAGRPIAQLVIPSYEQILKACLRTLARHRCLQLAIAAERFRLANDRWPTTLTELTPRFLPDVPTDPYTGEPLRLAPQPDGIIIYACGADTQDNGGTLSEDGKTPNTDLGVQLWSPAFRRLPPKAAP